MNMQVSLVDVGVIDKVLGLLARTNDDVVRETLALMCTLLFNANGYVQVTFLPFNNYTGGPFNTASPLRYSRP